ncbi:MAG TPA: hypothetical protein VK886_19880 [Vicinamibacterales bacterium]|nr:hypothetical protein [Vicinamibacterales bacterium]
MPAVHDDEVELAKAILTGANRRPLQSFGEYFGPEGGSCALGAAYEGILLLPRHVEHFRPKVWRLFSILEDVSRSCPEGCRKHIPIGALIVHLNDDHHWSRERIAAWLQGEVTEPKPDAAPPASKT